MGKHAAERHLWCVEVGRAALKLFSTDLLLYHDPAPIASLPHGISQAVARHYLSHRGGSCESWGVDTWIRAVAGSINRRDLWTRRQELLADAEQLAAMGVILRIDQKLGGIEQKLGGVEQKLGIEGPLQDPQGLAGP